MSTHFDSICTLKVAGKESFAFKCHRQDTNVFSVNAIAFQEQFGTFATVGSDGVVSLFCDLI